MCLKYVYFFRISIMFNEPGVCIVFLNKFRYKNFRNNEPKKYIYCFSQIISIDCDEKNDSF